MRRLIVVLGLLACSSASFAVPISYDVAYTPGPEHVGPAGVGTLIWDSETLLLSELTWDFGDGDTGGLTPFILGLELQGYTWGAYLYEQIIGVDFLGGAGFNTFSFGHVFGDFPGVGIGSMNFGSLGLSTYEMVTFREGYPVTLVSGDITVSSRSVPEPGTWALLIAGLVGILFARRRTLANR